MLLSDLPFANPLPVRAFLLIVPGSIFWSGSPFSSCHQHQITNMTGIKPVESKLKSCQIHQLNPYRQITGAWARPIYGKLIQPKLMSTYSVFFKLGVWARPISGKLIQSSILEFWRMTRVDFWKTHPNMDEFSRNQYRYYTKTECVMEIEIPKK